MAAQLLFFFSALGVFNGLIIAVYLFASARRSQVKLCLGLLLVMLSIRVGKSVFFYFSPDLSKHFLQLGLSACMLIGPCLYLYSCALKGQKSLSLSNWAHLIVPCVALVVVGGMYPYPSHPELWGTVIFKVVNFTWLFYILYSFRHFRQMFNELVKRRDAISLSQLLPLSVYLGTTLIWLAFFTSSYTSYISGGISFSIVLYLSVLIVLSAKRERQHARYQNKSIPDSEIQSLQDKLNGLFEQDKVFLDARLTLPVLAKKMSTSVPKLSQLLNDNLGKSFAQFINEYRIEHAKKLLTEAPHLTIELVSEQCGYNSMSTFYSAFKSETGVTPAAYKRANSN